MESQEQIVRPRVLKVESEESWNLITEEAKAEGSPVLAHFMASSCIPSIAMNPFFEALAQSYQDVHFLLVDVDSAKAVATRMGVKAMPTFLFMNEGNVVDKMVGANPDEIRRRMDGFIQTFHHPHVVESI
ncbi:thioredoxin family protein CXXS1 [Wolffia australiana]